jgi:hypothetical protein
MNKLTKTNISAADMVDLHRYPIADLDGRESREFGSPRNPYRRS